MRARLGQVLWWAGALLAAGIGIALFVGALQERNYIGAMATPLSICLAAPFWAACYVVAGSFWRPPLAP